MDIDIITNKVMYGLGEMTTVIGFFIMMVGLVTMIYSSEPVQKIEVDFV